MGTAPPQKSTAQRQKSEAREGGRRTLKLSDAVQSTTALQWRSRTGKAKGRERGNGFIIHHLIWPRMTDKRTGPRALRGGRTGNADNSAAKVPFVRRARALHYIHKSPAHVEK